jgi:hypothetical protein
MNAGTPIKTTVLLKQQPDVALEFLISHSMRTRAPLHKGVKATGAKLQDTAHLLNAEEVAVVRDELMFGGYLRGTIGCYFSG